MTATGFSVCILAPSKGEDMAKCCSDEPTIVEPALPIAVTVFDGAEGKDASHLFERVEWKEVCSIFTTIVLDSSHVLATLKNVDIITTAITISNTANAKIAV